MVFSLKSYFKIFMTPKVNKNKSKKKNLRTYPNFLHNTSNKYIKSILLSIRIPSFNTLAMKGSMTIEAALIMPLFLMGLIFLLSMIEIIRLQSEIEQVMHQYGKKTAVYSYAYDQLQSNDSNFIDVFESVGFSSIFLKKEMEDKMGKAYLEQSPLVGGSNKINYIYSSFMKNDIIDLVVIYKVSPYSNVFGNKSITQMNRCRLRAWTGYDPSLDEKNTRLENETKYVYITQDGEVYHLNRNCTHLVLSIQECSSNSLENFRNENGSKYTICEICGESSNLKQNRIYITENGDRYHISHNCSGLKRTVMIIPVSEAGGRRVCSRCSSFVG